MPNLRKILFVSENSEWVKKDETCLQKFKREVEVILMETNFLSGGTGLLHQDDKKLQRAQLTLSRGILKHFQVVIILKRTMTVTLVEINVLVVIIISLSSTKSKGQIFHRALFRLADLIIVELDFADLYSKFDPPNP